MIRQLARPRIILLLSVLWLSWLGGRSLAQQRAEQSARIHPGPQSDGSILLPTGWSISPAGKQIPLSTMPMAAVLSPDDRYLLVLNGGFLPPTISVIDLQTETETGRVAVKDAWHGITFNKAGDKVYVGGGSEASVFEFGFQAGKLTPQRVFPVVAAQRKTPSDHVGDILLDAEGRYLYTANLFRDSITVLNAQTGIVVREFPTGRRPYRLILGPGGKTLLVSHWGEASIGVYDLADGRLLERVPVGLHPTDMVLQPWQREAAADDQPALVARLFVAAAGTNSVFVLGLTESPRFFPLERIPVGPTPNAPAGSMPTALALRRDGAWLYTVVSGNNAIVVADISEERSELLGAIPTGWFPTAAVPLRDGRLLYLNGKGDGSKPAPRGPDPTRRGEEQQYVASLQLGSLGILPPLNGERIVRLTDRVIANTLYDDSAMTPAAAPVGSPVPSRPGDASPIRHVIYVVKENRTFDQVLGDFKGAKGDPGLVVFGEDVAPNHRKLAREFTLLDNFYTAGDVSADGQNWTFGALANDFVEKLWPSYYGRRRGVYDFEGGEPAALPPAGYLWTNARAAGLAVRSYGVWTQPAQSRGSASVKDPGLVADSDASFPPFDLDTPEQARVDEFLRELGEYETKGELPRLMLVRLPNDHTAGRAPGKPTALAMMAEHDYALGRLVEGVSKSKFWPQTAIFIVEDDAQDGADHVDSHRSPAFVVSPYARRGFVDNTFYSTPSVLRTIELILGLRPMTQFDAAATPLSAVFTSDVNATPYEAVRPRQGFDQKNPDGEGGLPRRVEARPRPESRARIAWHPSQQRQPVTVLP
ncbi:MAG: bifunctional YncE family protein/alkaline phosphatase family protein [Bryobacterales bacterium]